MTKTSENTFPAYDPTQACVPHRQFRMPSKNSAGLPVGVSLIGPAGSDLALIRLATALSKILAV